MDIRLLAILLLLAGIVLGAMVPGLIYVTAFLVGFVVVFLWRTNANTPSGGGSLAALGLTAMVIGGLLCLLIPAWLVHLLK